jgi:hypothetical protein
MQLLLSHKRYDRFTSTTLTMASPIELVDVGADLCGARTKGLVLSARASGDIRRDPHAASPAARAEHPNGREAVDMERLALFWLITG